MRIVELTKVKNEVIEIFFNSINGIKLMIRHNGYKKISKLKDNIKKFTSKVETKRFI